MLIILIYSSKQTLVKFGFSYQSYVFGGPDKWMHHAELVNLFGVFRFEVLGVCMGNANFEWVSWISGCIWSMFSLHMPSWLRIGVFPKLVGVFGSVGGTYFSELCTAMYHWIIFEPQNHLDSPPDRLNITF